MDKYENNQQTEDAINTAIRLRLSVWRKSLGSRAVVCSQIGVKETTLKNWEKGYRQVNLLAILAWHQNGLISTEVRDYLLFGSPLA
ncbi:MAG: hypothetical protein ACRCXB_25775 [Aeromonadaceae bacterium]